MIIEQNIQKDSSLLENYLREYHDQNQIKPKIYGRISSSNVSRRIIINSDQEAEDWNKARTLVRSVIHRYVITPDNQWVTRKFEEGCAKNKEQIYRWTSRGYRQVCEWLESEGIDNPEILPDKKNTRLLGKQVTAIYLMYNLNGKSLHTSLNKNEFTVPLIASELVRLKY